MRSTARQSLGRARQRGGSKAPGGEERLGGAGSCTGTDDLSCVHKKVRLVMSSCPKGKALASLARTHVRQPMTLPWRRGKQGTGQRHKVRRSSDGARMRSTVAAPASVRLGLMAGTQTTAVAQWRDTSRQHGGWVSRAWPGSSPSARRLVPQHGEGGDAHLRSLSVAVRRR